MIYRSIVRVFCIFYFTTIICHELCFNRSLFIMNLKYLLICGFGDALEELVQVTGNLI
jgi:hypothetical protein